MEELKKYLSTNAKKHLIFDFDETLVKLFLPWKKSISKLEPRIREIDNELFLQHGYLNYRLYNQLMKRHGQAIRNEINDFYRGIEENDLVKVTVNRPAFDFIRENKGKYLFYIWSSNQAETINRIIRANGFEKLFSKIMAPPKLDFFKPDKNGFENIFKNGRKNDYLMIGDSDYDRQAAENAGIDYFFLIFSPEE